MVLLSSLHCCMNLIIDIGNTFTKLAVFNDGELMHTISCTKESFNNALQEIKKSFPIAANCIVSASGALDKSLIDTLEDGYQLHILSKDSKIPFINLYATPATLGVDRVALIACAAIKFPKENVLVIDAGSAITFDFLNNKNEYLGGAIAPGIKMRYKALHQFTAKLPLLEPTSPQHFIGDTTATSMHVGVVQGVLDEIDSAIVRYKQHYADLTVILTGGDAHFLRDSLKNGIFAHSNFLLEGLNCILEHNND